jgi:hypothetical protein
LWLTNQGCQPPTNMLVRRRIHRTWN